MELNESYWSTRYVKQQTGWDIGYASPALVEYVLNHVPKSAKILIPGCGNAHEASYLWDRGYMNIQLLDISPQPLKYFAGKHPDFPRKQLIRSDFFELEDTYDVIMEQTFFCALHPSSRNSYVDKMRQLLHPEGILFGLLFNIPLNEERPPFGGNEMEYKHLFSSGFHIVKMETARNSIPPRKGNELFFICTPKKVRISN